MLVSEGHRDAGLYPLAYMLCEAEIARERINARIKTEMILTQSAIASALSKKGAAAFKELIEDL